MAKENKTDKKKSEIEVLTDRVNNLESVISRIAVLTGNGNHLAECGIEKWIPGKKHMSKRTS